jgi:hypothetical protein
VVNPLEQPWLVPENPNAPDERITIHAGSEKYAVAFTDPIKAALFLADQRDPGLTLTTFDTWVMKDAFLTAVTMLGVTRVMFDYVPGNQNAMSAPITTLRQWVGEAMRNER